jgi:hypothetical protein
MVASHLYHVNITTGFPKLSLYLRLFVRVEHSGVFGVHEHRLEVREERSENSRKWLEQSSNGLKGTRAVASAYGPDTEGAVGPGL